MHSPSYRHRLLVWALLSLTFMGALVAACHPARVRAETPAFRPEGRVFYVAPTGNDANPGTVTAPWRTIQHAAETVGPGDTVYVRAGIYNEAVSVRVSGSGPDQYITFRNYPGETPVLDGRGLTDPDGVNAFYIEDQSYLIIRGFEIRNYTTVVPNQVPIAIQITGTSHHIQLLENHIHHIATRAPVDADLLGADAHGIAVYGTAPSPIHNVLIENNHLHDLTLGSSEALVLNGNVRAFTVTHNLIHDVDNIAIDAIGFEGTAPQPEVDRAREGLIAGNTIYNVDSRTNPAYGGERSAGGIYVDGGAHITIEGNTVFSANIGIELASEHPGRETSDILVRNNMLYHNHMTGIALGGYDSERGSTRNVILVNNTLFHNDTDHTGSGEMLLQYDVQNTMVKNNILYANGQGILISNPFLENRNNVVDYNLYFADGSPARWQWRKRWFLGFDAYRTGTGNDAHGLFADPRFVAPARADLHIQPGSPAVDRGDPTAPSGNVDIDGHPRVVGSGVDIGADEVQSPARVYLPLAWIKHE